MLKFIIPIAVIAILVVAAIVTIKVLRTRKRKVHLYDAGECRYGYWLDISLMSGEVLQVDMFSNFGGYVDLWDLADHCDGAYLRDDEYLILNTMNSSQTIPISGIANVNIEVCDRDAETEDATANE